ncbi:MAG: hypothetical protein ABWZ15_00605 [Acidimicrobiia bacterium]
MAATSLAARREPAAPTRPAPIAPEETSAAGASTAAVGDAGATQVIDYLEVASVAPQTSVGSAEQATPAPSADRSVTLVQGAVGPPVSATEEYAVRALAGSLLPARATGAWSTLGAAAARFGPWLALLLIALIIHGVARSALADKLRGSRAQ